MRKKIIQKKVTEKKMFFTKKDLHKKYTSYLRNIFLYRKCKCYNQKHNSSLPFFKQNVFEHKKHELAQRQ